MVFLSCLQNRRIHYIRSPEFCHIIKCSRYIFFYIRRDCISMKVMSNRRVVFNEFRKYYFFMSVGRLTYTAYVMSCDYVKGVVALKIYTLDSFEEVHCVIGLSAISKKKKIE